MVALPKHKRFRYEKHVNRDDQDSSCLNDGCRTMQAIVEYQQDEQVETVPGTLSAQKTCGVAYPIAREGKGPFSVCPEAERGSQHVDDTHADLRFNPARNYRQEETVGGRIGYDANDAVLNELPCHTHDIWQKYSACWCSAYQAPRAPRRRPRPELCSYFIAFIAKTPTKVSEMPDQRSFTINLRISGRRAATLKIPGNSLGTIVARVVNTVSSSL
jgi:hypothetical protein